ncbi:ribosome hibernation-promoting factor, HPF/YfiA family [Pinisolibacter aquiterrae]|jgi:ribosomal subunit interface protein|uniref:ribosome hibernation-promoting factor, HPF/YfiA family n=1 Tax=Pinisolibacter aquiterrae TaxID=2815579 RepID=UPI001C3CFE8A|nr:ribosome-associated translation inhibitor RaiA [Pinisolibacter aquiterrae]MBV5265520.1 ribosome-associated translation inhibitor RaiA [Pinisolibacter aquiterrae]MCC8236913.1 ribosome-associated translation inhibitor RaiA [Pinisolibacter aquiterrae]
MTLRVSGKNVDIGESLRGHAETRVGEALAKYFSGSFKGHATVEKEGIGFRTECALHLGTGITVQAVGAAQDPYLSVDQAIDRIEKQLRRYKRRLSDHNAAQGRAQVAETAYRVLEATAEDEEVPVDFHPAVIAESTKPLKTLTVGDAVQELDLTAAAFVMFRNAANGGLNVVYRRDDGNIGWVDPSLTAVA